jgi:antitoxin VapB
MPLNIKHPAVERMATEAARRQGITRTEAVRRALEAHLATLHETSTDARAADLVEFLERDVWPFVPTEVLGQPLSKDERERILVYGDEGA